MKCNLGCSRYMKIQTGIFDCIHFKLCGAMIKRVSIAAFLFLSVFIFHSLHVESNDFTKRLKKIKDRIDIFWNMFFQNTALILRVQTSKCSNFHVPRTLHLHKQYCTLFLPLWLSVCYHISSTSSVCTVTMSWTLWFS